MKHFKQAGGFVVRLAILIAISLQLAACVGIAAESLDTFVGTKFSNPDPMYPSYNQKTRDRYTGLARGEKWIYKEEPEGMGRRVFINYFRHCRYSLLIDENDIIQSWRDEGGPVHMRDCKFS